MQSYIMPSPFRDFSSICFRGPCPSWAVRIRILLHAFCSFCVVITINYGIVLIIQLAPFPTKWQFMQMLNEDFCFVFFLCHRIFFGIIAINECCLGSLRLFFNGMLRCSVWLPSGQRSTTTIRYLKFHGLNNLFIHNFLNSTIFNPPQIFTSGTPVCCYNTVNFSYKNVAISEIGPS